LNKDGIKAAETTLYAVKFAVDMYLYFGMHFYLYLDVFIQNCLTELCS
jgi:hypothetical protein